MRLKFLLLSLLCILGMTLQAQNKSYRYVFTEDFVNNGTPVHAEKLTVWFDTDFEYALRVSEPEMKNVSSIFNTEAFTSSSGTAITTGYDMIANEANRVNCADKLHGAAITPTFENGMLCVTVPYTLDYPTGGVASSTITNGAVLFHMNLGSKPNRVNDSKNSWDAYTIDATGMFIGIQAPAGRTVQGYFGSTSEDLKDGFGKFTHAAYFNFGAIPSNDYVELTSGAPYNDDCFFKSLKVGSTTWSNGYVCKYVDIAVRGAKPGDKIYLKGIQTLHPEVSAESFVNSSAVSEITSVENNPVEYYNLQGMCVGNPSNGLFIKHQGNKVEKVFIK